MQGGLVARPERGAGPGSYRAYAHGHRSEPEYCTTRAFHLTPVTGGQIEVLWSDEQTAHLAEIGSLLITIAHAGFELRSII